MCARFDLDTAVVDESIAAADTFNPEIRRLPVGTVRPSDPALVIAGQKDRIHAGIMTWGLPRYDGRGLVINARSETALEKQMFRDSMLRRRCVIPARVFHEWDPDRQMVTFSLKNRRTIWMAGIYDEAHRYSVLTTAANLSVGRFHDRMPVLLEREVLRAWLFDPEAAVRLMARKMPELQHHQEYEQTSLF